MVISYNSIDISCTTINTFDSLDRIIHNNIFEK